MRRVWVIAAVAVLTVAFASPTSTASPRTDAAKRGADWLAGRQHSNGSFAGAERSDLTAHALSAVVVGGGSGSVVDRALSYIAKNGKEDATQSAYAGHIVAGIVAGGGDPRDHGGTDFVAMLDAAYNPITGAYDSEKLFSNLLVANGVLAAKRKLPSAAIDYIKANACIDGGFSWQNNCGAGADVDTTSWAINVLVAAGAKEDAVVEAARDFLLSAQRGDGGFGFYKSLPTGSDSTGLALTAIAALGETARRAPWRQADGDDPVAALMKLQNVSGGFRATANGKINTTSTVNAIVGMAGESYPIEPREPDGSPSDDGGSPQQDDGQPRTAGSGGDKKKPEGSVGEEAGGTQTAAPKSPVASPRATDGATRADPEVADRSIRSSTDTAQSFGEPEEGSGVSPWIAGGGLVVGAGMSAGGWWWLRRLRQPLDGA